MLEAVTLPRPPDPRVACRRASAVGVARPWRPLWSPRDSGSSGFLHAYDVAPAHAAPPCLFPVGFARTLLTPFAARHTLAAPRPRQEIRPWRWKRDGGDKLRRSAMADRC